MFTSPFIIRLADCSLVAGKGLIVDYISTRGNDGPLGFEQTLLSGLARDGGLYLPVEWPAFSPAEIAGMRGLSYVNFRPGYGAIL